MRLPRLKTAALFSATLATFVLASCANGDGSSSAEETPYEGSSTVEGTDFTGMNNSAEESSAEVEIEPAKPAMTPEEMKLAELLDAYARNAEMQMRAGNYGDALDTIDKGLLLDSDDARLMRLHREVVATIGPGHSYRGEIDDAGAKASEASYNIRRYVREAEEHLQNGDHAKAIEAANDAIDLINWTKHMVADDNSLRIARDIIVKANDAREEQRLKDRKSLIEQRRREQEMQAARELDQFRSEIRAKYDEAQDLFNRREYREAALRLDHILHRDPDNEAVQQLKAVALDLDRAMIEKSSQEDFRKRWLRAMEEIEAAYIFPAEAVSFSSYSYWRTVERRALRVLRGASPDVDKQDLAVRATLETQRVRVDISGSETLEEIFNEWKRAARGVNMVFDSELELDQEPKELQLGEVTLGRALNILKSREVEFDWYVANGAIFITSPDSDKSEGRIQRVFNVSDILINLTHFKGREPRLSQEQSDGRFPADEAEVDTSEFEIDEDTLKDAIMESIDPESWDDAEPEIRQGTLLVSNTLDNINRVNQLLQDLRRTAGLVVNVETRFITIRDDFLLDIGVDFRGVGGAPQGTNPQPVAAALDDVNVGTNNVPVGAGTDNEAGFFFQDINPNQSVNTDIRTRVENLFDKAVGGRRGGFGLTNNGGASFQLSFVDNPEITAVLRAVKKSERASLLTAPSVSVHNTQRGYVSMLNELSYISDFEVNVAATSTIADPIVEVIRDGIVLDVRPTVSADRRYVTLELRPTLATLLRPIATINTTLAVGPPVSIQTPELQLQRLRSTVTVPDRGSFLLGGLRRLIESEVISGVPILSDLPIIGWLFSRKAKNKTRMDVIVIVSVEIVDLSEQADRFRGGITE